MYLLLILRWINIVVHSGNGLLLRGYKTDPLRRVSECQLASVSLLRMYFLLISDRAKVTRTGIIVVHAAMELIKAVSATITLVTKVKQRLCLVPIFNRLVLLGWNAICNCHVLSAALILVVATVHIDSRVLNFDTRFGVVNTPTCLMRWGNYLGD